MKQNEKEYELHLGDYIRILRKRINLIIFIFIIVTLSTAFFTFRQPKVYTTSCMLEILKEQSFLEMMFAPAEMYNKTSVVSLETRIKNIQTRPLAIKVVKLLQDDFFKGNFTEEQLNEKAELLLKMIEVEQDGTSDRIKISITGNDATLITKIVNAFSEIYVSQDLEDKYRKVHNILDFLNKELEKAENNLFRLEDELEQYKSKQGVIDLESDVKNKLELSAKYENDFQETKTKKKILETRLQEINYILKEKKIDKYIQTQSSQIPNPAITSLKNEISNLEIKKIDLSAKYNDEHPYIKRINDQIKELKEKLSDEMKEKYVLSEQIKSLNTFYKGLIDERIQLMIEIETIEAKLNILEIENENLKNFIKEIPEKSMELARLTRMIMMAQNIYTTLKNKKTDFELQKNSIISSVVIRESAIEPKIAIKPTPAKTITLGGLVGLTIGILMTFVLESISRTLSRVEELEAYTGAQVIGMIPTITPQYEKESQRSADKELNAMQRRLITAYSPKSPIAEGFRTLRTNLQFSIFKEPHLSLLITSAGPQEGKSTVTSNLSIAFGQLGKKTIVLDCNMRRPTENIVWGHKREPGMSDILISKIKWQDTIKDTLYPNLKVITSGIIPPNPSELLNLKIFEKILMEIKKEFEYVLIDAPPLLPVPDSVIISSKADGVLLVHRLKGVKPDALVRAVTVIKNAGGVIIGICLNDIVYGKEMDISYGYYAYHYYGEKSKKI